MRSTLLTLALLTAACGGGGGGFFRGGPITPDADGGVGDAGDMAGAASHDMALTSAADLSRPPDLLRLPDLSVPCVAGSYIGPLTGKFSVGGLPFNVTGTANLVLGAPQGAILPITSGTLMASGAGASFSATLTGDVDCDQRKIVNGMMVNGMASAFGVNIPFTGTAAADYSVARIDLENGTCAANAFMGTCTWSATFQP